MCIKDKKRCVFLDANALYHYLGREKLFSQPSTNVDRSILENKLGKYANIYLPSSVLTEILVHFRNELSKIQEIFYFIATKKIKIVPVGIKEYSTSELNSFASMNENDKIEYLNKQLEEKIDVESRFAYTFLFSISVAYAGFLARKKGLNENAFVGAFGNYIKSNYMQNHLTELKTSLEQGYSLNKELKYLKDKYTDLLTHNVILAYGALLNVSTASVSNETEVVNTIKELEDLGITEKDYNIMDTIQSINEDIDFTQLVLTEIPKTFSIKKYTEVQINYLKTRYEAWILRGQKLRKNDIYDILYLEAYSNRNLESLKYNLKNKKLSLSDIILVSFDDDVKEYIYTISNSSKELLEEISST